MATVKPCAGISIFSTNEQPNGIPIWEKPRLIHTLLTSYTQSMCNYAGLSVKGKAGKAFKSIQEDILMNLEETKIPSIIFS